MLGMAHPSEGTGACCCCCCCSSAGGTGDIHQKRTTMLQAGHRLRDTEGHTHQHHQTGEMRTLQEERGKVSNWMDAWIGADWVWVTAYDCWDTGWLVWALQTLGDYRRML